MHTYVHTYVHFNPVITCGLNFSMDTQFQSHHHAANGEGGREGGREGVQQSWPRFGVVVLVNSYALTLHLQTKCYVHAYSDASEARAVVPQRRA